MATDLELCINEGWRPFKEKGKDIVEVLGVRYPIVHPFSIWCKIFREEKNPDIKYKALRRMHYYAWPKYESTFNYWDERRLYTFCEGWTYISLAGGASTAKSDCTARLCLLYWLSDPAKNIVIVASTTLSALENRIWGYIIRLKGELGIEYPCQSYRGNTPKILWDKNDPIHGMFAVAAGRGTDDQTIANWIGRHPKGGMLICLDEAPDLNPSLLKSLPNLEAGGIDFCCIPIGNSNSIHDLHGALSTPEDGWNSIDITKDTKWRTTQKNGVCLFFNAYESPAIHEKDPVKKKLLSKFLITKEQIEEKKKAYGEDSVSFYRFVLGFWKFGDFEATIVSDMFLKSYNPTSRAEWSGLRELQIAAGLDPAFSSGGDTAILRLAYLGQDSTGKIVLDFRGNQLLFRIPIIAKESEGAPELQLTKKVLAILKEYRIPLSSLVIDSNGQGRALGELMRLQAGELRSPIKMYSVKVGFGTTNSFDVVIKSTYELWNTIREFIQTDSIRGLDNNTIWQLQNRLVEDRNGKLVLESKPEFKRRMAAITPSLAHSPDEADSVALCLQSAIINYGFSPGQYLALDKQSSFERQKLKAIEEALRGGGVQETHTEDTYQKIVSSNFTQGLETLAEYKLDILS